MDQTDNLTGKLLIAMPGMADPRFDRSVVLICAHSDDGAMGLVVNRPLRELQFDELLGQLDIDRGPSVQQIAVRFGGPVEPGRGFVLHNTEAAASRDEDAPEPPEGQLAIAPGLAMTTTRDILEELARGSGPSQAVLALGYAGWGPGQLEGEMLANGWLTAERSDAILFGADDDAKWAMALRQMGVDPSVLSAAAGRA
ncbi:DUF179 domain-containing protein [Paracoccus suum]|uniref:UPF0301 protein DRW48_02860 n=1 Tax=Paracoccus suum TaxID=2259340 RepID=A0A344PHB6_9RHOB|nr:YqgE/AlgH family protein [Paracoccus suum]AXC48771.1 DUF179 domain-containing protein [Paracoccus suum]